ncbi:hypothetical protein HK405_011742, partial [Cladochytrium tenue]
ISTASNQAASKEHEQLEREIQRMRVESSAAVSLAEQRAHRADIDLDQTKRRLDEARGRAHKAVMRTLEDVLTLREHMSESLADLRDAADRQLAELKAAVGPAAAAAVEAALAV